MNMDSFINLPWRIQEPAMLDRIPEFITEEYLKHSCVYSMSTEMFIKEHKKETAQNTKSNNVEKTECNTTKKKSKEKPNQTKFQHIPGYRELPCDKSNLTINQHKMCLDVMIAMQKGTLKSLPLQKKKCLEQLDSKIREERVLYAQLAEQAWKQSGYMKLNEIDQELNSYYNKHWIKSCDRVFKYPKYFDKPSLIPLLHTESEIEISFVQNLVEQGNIPLLNIPKQLGKKRIILQKTECSINAISSLKEMDKKTVSEDNLAEKLAQNHNADVVISSSALKRIVDNYPPFTSTWHIPVTIKECETTDVKGLLVRKKILYIDKPFPKNPQTAIEKNEWIFKKLLKPILINGIGYSFPQTEEYSDIIKNDKQNSDKLDTSNTLKQCSVNVCTDCMDIYKSEFNSSIENTSLTDSINSNESTDHSDFMEQIQNKMDDQKDNSENNETKGPENIRRSNRKRKLPAVDLINSASDHIKQSHIPIVSIERPKRHNVKRLFSHYNTPKSHNEISDTCKCEMKLRFKQKSGDDIKNELNKIESSLSTLKQNENEHVDINTNTDKLLSNESNDEVNVNADTLNENSDKKTKTHKMGNIWSEISENMFKENYHKSENNDVVNVTYRLWHLKPNSIKNELINQEHAKYVVLIRSKIDACEKLPNNTFQSVVIAPKNEYQLEYGAEHPTKSEICKQWLSLLIRPYSSLLRVRVDPTTSDVLATQRSNPANLFVEASIYNFNPNKGLNVFYSIVNKLLTLPSGEYLLSHTPRNASFAEVRKRSTVESEDTFNLHELYESNTNLTVSSVIPWTPLDTNFILPNNIFQKVLPGLFKRTQEKGNQQNKQKSVKKGNKKKNMKSKQNVSKQWDLVDK